MILTARVFLYLYLLVFVVPLKEFVGAVVVVVDCWWRLLCLLFISFLSRFA